MDPNEGECTYIEPWFLGCSDSVPPLEIRWLLVLMLYILIYFSFVAILSFGSLFLASCHFLMFSCYTRLFLIPTTHTTVHNVLCHTHPMFMILDIQWCCIFEGNMFILPRVLQDDSEVNMVRYLDLIHSRFLVRKSWYVTSAAPLRP